MLMSPTVLVNTPYKRLSQLNKIAIKTHCLMDSKEDKNNFNNTCDRFQSHNLI